MVSTAAGAAIAHAAPLASDPPASFERVEIVITDAVAADDLVTLLRSVDGVVLSLRSLAGTVVALAEIPLARRASLASDVTALGGVLRSPEPVDVRPSHDPSLSSDDPSADVTDVAASTASGRLVEAIDTTSTDPAELLNATAWNAAGYTGAGVRIGVIDYIDVTKYWDENAHGPRPVAGVTARCLDLGSDCTSEFFDGVDLGGEDHGVAVVETIRDIAPDVQIFIGQATSISDYSEIVDWMIGNGVQIINRSLGSRFDGPGDGRGALDDLVASVASRGVLWVNSGGNNGVDRYYREPVRTIGDRVAFGATNSTTFLEFKGCVKLAGVRWANDWDLPPAARTDYDIFLWEAPTGRPEAGTIIDSGRAPQRAGALPIEHLRDDHCPASGTTLYLEVRLVAGDPAGDVLEIADYDAGMTSFTQTAYSAAVSVVDSDDQGVIAVGAIDPGDPATIADYSSQGPTNDGRVAPDVSARSRFANEAYGGIFAGTSAAAAAVSGGAALLVDAELALPGRPLGNLVRHMVVDHGPTGPDPAFGHGEFVLGDPPIGIDAAGTPSTFVALDAAERVLDTRPDHAVGPADLIGELWAGEILDLPVVEQASLPDGEVTAVAVNLVSVAAAEPSHVQALPTNRATLGAFANVTIDRAGQTRGNFAIVPVGDDGSISINSITDGHLVVDLLGWFRSTPGPATGGRFVELPASERVLDSRFDEPVRPLVSGEVRAVPMPEGVDPGRVAALVVTVTATRPTGAGWIQAIPSGRTDVVGSTATVNFATGDTIGNAAIVPVADGGIALTSYITDGATTDVVVDVTGYITSPSAASGADGRFVALRPDRAFDSRRTGGALTDQQTVVADATTVGVPTSASGVVWNLTAAGATRAGHITGWAADHPMPPTATLAWNVAPLTRSAGAIAAVDAGRTAFRAEDGPVDSPAPLTHVVADAFGYFT